jgi:hypothetical protein
MGAPLSWGRWLTQSRPPASFATMRSLAWLDGEDAGVAAAEPCGAAVACQQTRLEADGD